MNISVKKLHKNQNATDDSNHCTSCTDDCVNFSGFGIMLLFGQVINSRSKNQNSDDQTYYFD